MNTLAARELDVRIGNVHICSRFDWQMQAGEIWGMLGMNGAGKTTLLHTLAGLREPNAGRVLLNDQPLTTLSRRRIAQQLGVLFQSQYEEFPGTVIESTLAGRHPHLHAWQFETEADRQLALQALASVGLAELAQRNVLTLSGGEQQRLAIASLLVQSPQLWLLDEPHNHLDPHQQIRLLDRLVQHVQVHDNSLCMSLHDVNLANRYCSHLLLLYGNAEVIAGPRDEVLNEANLSRLYGHPMCCLQAGKRSAWLPA
ncbi:ABC transporter ATP-binding protein [Sulfuriflexus sp.]|uniref:ABC transporter ATP-binding protein n=1 Tax=Sulfuriflexus sp. TaxID=2015443 RepID=UPI0028CEFC35|nr:ABC transporter ATP-binding protein [Sulfuriflexus sp.]MDT8402993.1 ABC transporter ATP-binding protein [Sulfuriflexus sp.]